jgi:uncharacterized membrane protein (UPF0127 family)
VQSVATIPTELTAPTAATTTTAPAPTTAATTTAPAASVPADLAAFGTETITVGGFEWLVAVADTPEERFQGLRRVADLGALDGMIFVWDTAVESAFTMRTVPIALDIGFFGADGVLFDVVRMEPCGDSDDCPLYTTEGPFQFAIETAAGSWAGIPQAAPLVRP